MTDLAKVLIELGEAPRAIELSQQVVEIYSKAHGAEHHTVAETLVLLGRARALAGDVQRALETLERAVQILVSSGAEPTALAEARWRLAQIVWQQGIDRPRAIELAQQAVAALTADDSAKSRRHEDALTKELKRWQDAEAEPRRHAGP